MDNKEGEKIPQEIYDMLAKNNELISEWYKMEENDPFKIAEKEAFKIKKSEDG